MLKPNTWKELEGMLQCAGFKTAQPFWRNHMFVGAIAIKQGKIMNDFLKGIQHLKKDQYLGNIVSTMDIPSFKPETNYFKSLSMAVFIIILFFHYLQANLK